MSQPPPGDDSKSSRAAARTLLIGLAALATSTLFCCGGLCLGGLVIGAPTVDRVVNGFGNRFANRMNRRVWTPPPFIAPAPIVAPQWAQNWVVSEQLTRVYTTALDLVVNDRQVKSRLGEPIETATDGSELYRRQGRGDLDLSSEVIAFDIKGPKARAFVTITAVSPPPPNLPGSPPAGPDPNRLEIERIVVVLEDGTTFEVPPPQREDPDPFRGVSGLPP